MISQLEAHEWRLLAALRLAALEESPDAFSPTFADALEFDDERWRRAARGFAESAQVAMFIARPDRGLCSAEMSCKIGHVGAMWVRPDARDAKLGSALLDAALEFLGGCEAVRLTVTETNGRARALYESRGFRLTGRSEPLRPGSTLENLEMELVCGDET